MRHPCDKVRVRLVSNGECPYCKIKELDAAHQEIIDQKTFAISFKQKWLNSFEIAQKALGNKK